MVLDKRYFNDLLEEERRGLSDNTVARIWLHGGIAMIAGCFMLGRGKSCAIKSLGGAAVCFGAFLNMGTSHMIGKRCMIEEIAKDAPEPEEPSDEDESEE